MNNETRYLAVDYGEKRVGLAITDPLKIIAVPLSTLQNDNRLLENLSLVILEQGIERIVLGFPGRPDGEATAVTEKISMFKAKLESSFKMPVILFDERYTSSLALDRVLQKSTKRQRRSDKGLIDRNAAAILLEDYLRTL